MEAFHQELNNIIMEMDTVQCLPSDVDLTVYDLRETVVKAVLNQRCVVEITVGFKNREKFFLVTVAYREDRHEGDRCYTHYITKDKMDALVILGQLSSYLVED